MAKIEIKPHGIIKEVKTTVRIYDVAKETGLDWMFGCTQGNCGTCLSTIVSGMENLNRISDHEGETLRKLGAKSDQRLLCQVVVRGDVVVHKEKFGKPIEESR